MDVASSKQMIIHHTRLARPSCFHMKRLNKRKEPIWSYPYKTFWIHFVIHLCHSSTLILQSIQSCKHHPVTLFGVQPYCPILIRYISLLNISLHPNQWLWTIELLSAVQYRRRGTAKTKVLYRRGGTATMKALYRIVFLSAVQYRRGGTATMKALYRIVFYCWAPFSIVERG